MLSRATSRLAAALAVATFLFSPPLTALDYRTVLEKALAMDGTSANLARAEAQAETAWRIAVLGRDTPKAALKTGEMTAAWTAGTEGTQWAAGAKPAASLTAEPGWALTLEAPVTVAPSRVSAVPELGGRIPLAAGAGNQVAAAEAAQTLVRAREARFDRSLEVERALVDRLRDLLKARTVASRAEVVRLKALADWERAKTVDGAVPGGTAYAAKERAVRIATKDVRLAQAEVRKRQNDLVLLTGGSPGEAVDLPALPDSADEPLPPVDRCRPLTRAQADLRLAVWKEAATAPGPTLVARWGLGWALSAGTDSPGSTAPSAGATARTGLEASVEDWLIDAGVSWTAAGGPALTLSVGWVPAVPGTRSLEAAGRALALEGFAAAAQQAQERSAQGLADLEARRMELRLSVGDVANDLDYALGQQTLYQAWKEKGLVSATDLEEVEDAVREARNEADLVLLDWWTWDLDRRALCGPEKGE